MVPAHSFKYAATLQALASRENPVLIRIETKSGHGAVNTAKLIEQSPTLLRLKELEAAERMAANVGSIQLVGVGLDAVLGKLLPMGDVRALLPGGEAKA